MLAIIPRPSTTRIIKELKLSMSKIALNRVANLVRTIILIWDFEISGIPLQSPSYHMSSKVKEPSLCLFGWFGDGKTNR